MSALKHIFLCGISVSAALGLIAAQSVDKSPPPPNPVTSSHNLNNAKTPRAQQLININTDEGSWMNLDVSPDGQIIVFDLLGDIYTMPITGGTAVNIASGMSWDTQPRFSPDGQTIAFTSDRGGHDNIWIMGTSGGNVTQLTDAQDADIETPAWAANGDFIAARKTPHNGHLTKSSKANNIWIYNIDDGTGMPYEVERQKTLKSRVHTIVSDGIVTKDAVYNAASGHTPSTDGKSLAIVTAEKGNTILSIKDVESGAAEEIFNGLDPIKTRRFMAYPDYPNMDWSPDDKNLYFWFGGHIQRYDISTKDITKIPFQIDDTRLITHPAKVSPNIAPDVIELTTPRFAQMSPDGRTIVFESLGKLYLRDVETDKVWNLTTLPAAEREVYPVWSPDSQSLLFMTWTDDELGAIHSIDIKDREITTHTEEAGYYANLTISPSGEFFLYEKKSGKGVMPPSSTKDNGIYIQAIGSSDSIRISRDGHHPHFSGDGLRVYFTQTRKRKTLLRSVNLLGEDIKTHVRSKLKQIFHVAPKGRYVAAHSQGGIFLAPFSPEASPINFNAKGKTSHITKFGNGAAGFIHWTQNESTDDKAKLLVDKLYWTENAQLISATPSEIMGANGQDLNSAISLSYKSKPQIAEGQIALTNARIITMNGENGGVIETGSIVINAGRIADIGENIIIADGIKTLNMSGKTIMPGMIDVAGDITLSVDGLIPQQSDQAISSLAQGITAVMQITGGTLFNRLTASHMQQKGELLAPRLLIAGKTARGVKNQTLKELGIIALSGHAAQNRDSHQTNINTAQNAGLVTLTKTQTSYQKDMRLFQDGSHIIHTVQPNYTLYNDAQSMIAQSGTAYLPLIPRPENTPQLLDHKSPHSPPNKKVSARPAPQKTNKTDKSFAYLEGLIDSDTPILLGSVSAADTHQFNHALWGYQESGASNLDTIKAVTTRPAKALGLDAQIGSLETGKLADLVILSGNPLDDIRNTLRIEHVMLGGRLYDAETMNEVHTGTKKRLPYWWEDE